MTEPKLRFKADDGSKFPEWEEKTLFDVLDDVVDFRGRTPKKLGMDWCPEKTDYLALSALNVKMGYIDDSVEPHYGDSILYRRWMNGKELYKGEVLFTTEAPMGNVAQVPDNKPYILSQRVIALIPVKDVICDDFFCCVLQSRIVQLYLKKLATGGTAQGISQKSLEKLRLTFPSLSEQQKIASFLSSIDEIIQSTESELTAWQKRKNGVMQKIFNREVRFKADDGSEFPEWEEKRLGEVCEYGKSHGIGQNYVGTENMLSAFGGVMIENTESECNGILYSSGDILMSNIRPYLKKVWLANREGVCSTDVLVFHPMKIESKYLYCLIASDFFITKVMSAAKGSKMPRGDKKHIMEISVFVPCHLEQCKIAECLSTIDEATALIKQELSAWKEFKKGLLQQMFV